MVTLAAEATVGRYRLDRFLGQGGMGQVWAATHLVTNQRAALKVLLRSACVEPEVRRRFLREARAASAVSHRNVVKVHDFFEIEDGTPVMVMELLDGETLTERLRRDRALSLEVAASLLLPVISAVGKAHAIGVVHRDLKPDNVFLVNKGADVEPRVLDFGIAKLVDANIDETTGVESLTRSGTMLGTPSYMAPEQTLCEYEIDHRADIWALGAVLYEALAGTRPVDWNNVGQLVRNFMTHKITPIEALCPALPAEVASVVGQMLARDRAARPALSEVFRILSGYTRVTAEPFDSPLYRSDPNAGNLAPYSPPVQGTLPSAGQPALLSERSLRTIADRPEAADSTGAHELAPSSSPRTRTPAIVAAIALAAVLLAALLLPGREPRLTPIMAAPAAPPLAPGERTQSPGPRAAPADSLPPESSERSASPHVPSVTPTAPPSAAAVATAPRALPRSNAKPRHAPPPAARAEPSAAPRATASDDGIIDAVPF